MSRFIVERKSALVPGAWCNVRTLDAASWAAARAHYVEAEYSATMLKHAGGLTAVVYSSNIRCTEVSALNPRP